MPIRSVTGAAGLIPVWHGWNGAQLLMALCASIGIGVANLVNSVMGIPEVMTASTTVPVANVQEIGTEMVRGHFCVQDQYKDLARSKKTYLYQENPGLEEFQTPWGSAFSLSNETDSEGKVHIFAQVNYGSQPAYFGHSVDECGSARVERPSPKANAYPTTITLAAKSRDVTTTTMQGLNSDLQAFFTSIYQGIDPDDPDWLDDDGKLGHQLWSALNYVLWPLKQEIEYSGTLTEKSTAAIGLGRAIMNAVAIRNNSEAVELAAMFKSKDALLKTVAEILNTALGLDDAKAIWKAIDI